MKYLELFKNGFDDTVAEKIKPENYPFVGYSPSEGLVFTETSEATVHGPWVTFTAEEDNSSIGLYELSTNQTLEYSTDTITWNTFDTSTNISLNNGDKLYVRGILSGDNSKSNYTQFNMTGKITASGNCNAIWNYQDLNAPLKKCCGYRMFQNCSPLTTALELPATIILAPYCYQSMFYGCTSLTTAPELPATTLADWCYSDMFSRCSSLTTAPELPATTLAKNCYNSIFKGCSSLTTAPVLPATTLAERCYEFMFGSCTSLTTAPELPATTLAERCYEYMFYNCISLTTAPELPATTLVYKCYNNMFSNCTSLVVTPELHATTLDESCYSRMFDNCNKLNYIKCLATDITAYDCTFNWVSGVSSTGTFVKHPDMTGWTTGSSGIPEGWTVVDAEI